MNIREAVVECRNTELSGWELVHYAQNLVGKQMEYSYTNSFSLAVILHRLIRIK